MGVVTTMRARGWLRSGFPRLRALALILAALHPGTALAADEIHWTMTGPRSVVFDWRGTGNTLRYGLTAHYGLTLTARNPSITPFSSSGPFWEVRIDNLHPGAIYHYSIDGGPDHTFHSMPPPGSAFTVYAQGDMGSSAYPSMAGVQSLIATGGPSFVFGLGDFAYVEDHDLGAVDQHFNDVMVWSQDAAYMPAWGNHDWGDQGDDLRNYKGRFDLPNALGAPGEPLVSCCGEDWYWFDAGNVRFIGYPEPYPGAWAWWATAANELMDQAEANGSIHFIVTFGHRSAYSSGWHPGLAQLRGYLDSLGTRHPKYVLNLSAHSHDYERTSPQFGVTHVSVGIGGATLEPTSDACGWTGGCTPPSWSVYRAYHHGALRLKFDPYGIQAEALCGPASAYDDITCPPGEVIDSFYLGGDVAPILSGIRGNVSVTVGRPLALDVAVSDPRGRAITALAADLSSLPRGGDQQFTAGPGNRTGRLTWTPRTGDLGTHTVTFRASSARTTIATTLIDVHAVTDVPDGPAPVLAMERIRPSPAGAEFTLEYSLADGSGAQLEMFDVAGRLRRQIPLASAGPGRHEVRVRTPPGTRPGMYWLRLRQSGQAVRRTVVLIP
ncbi:MAG TPA: metallophosphoesterase [Methylomirabilota bacterium]|nr:metallophosphoesterase [Methylomirabilota bacterium]